MKNLNQLDEREILSLAIANEQEDSQIYQTFADSIRQDFPASATMFDEMAEDERGHRTMLFDLYSKKFGEHMPPIRREDVRGFYKRNPIWLSKMLSVEKMRAEAERMELQAASFYDKAAEQSTDTATKQMLMELASLERSHGIKAETLNADVTKTHGEAEHDTQHRKFVLQYVQPGLAGLVDGSVSTLAPVFAAAFATHSNWNTFLVGLAASLGAGVSMGLTEALSDDGTITGRGSEWTRGTVCGVMTAVGGLGHTLPYLVPDSWANAFYIATFIAIIIVILELWAIAWIRAKYMDTPFMKAVIQIVIGGLIVFGIGIAIGSA
jgi:erythrin-vacuolar iron transport family protein